LSRKEVVTTALDVCVKKAAPDWVRLFCLIIKKELFRLQKKGVAIPELFG
jgi:hypothetical protein